AWVLALPRPVRDRRPLGLGRPASPRRRTPLRRRARLLRRHVGDVARAGGRLVRPRLAGAAGGPGARRRLGSRPRWLLGLSATRSAKQLPAVVAAARPVARATPARLKLRVP